MLCCRVYSHAAMFYKGSSQKFHKLVERGARLLLTCLEEYSLRACSYHLQDRDGGVGINRSRVDQPEDIDQSVVHMFVNKLIFSPGGKIYGGLNILYLHSGLAGNIS